MYFPSLTFGLLSCTILKEGEGERSLIRITQHNSPLKGKQFYVKKSLLVPLYRVRETPQGLRVINQQEHRVK